MISVLTNEGALEFGRSLSGGSRFLAWEAALLSTGFDGSAVGDIAGITHEDVDLDAGLIKGHAIAHIFDCTGSLPVKVSANDGTETAAMAVDFDFNGQIPLEAGTHTTIEYAAVVALGRRFSKYPTVTMGRRYNKGDHVWAPDDTVRDYAYVCLTDNFEYEGILPNEDTANWMAVETATLLSYPGDSEFYSDPHGDVIPFYVTSYDDSVKMANGMEWEYKVRVFLDNVATRDLAKLAYFSRGGLEADGSMALTFLASISEQFRIIRDTVSTAS